MRLALLTFALLSTSLSGAFAANLDAPSQIDAVTVFPQGAEVTRLTSIKLPAGATTLLLEDLPGEADPQSIRVEGAAGEGVEITSVDTRSMPLFSEAQDAERKSVEKQIEALQDERSGLDQTVADADYQKRLLMALADKQLTPVSMPDKPATIDGTGLGSVLDVVATKLGAISRTVHAAQLRQRDIDKQVGELQVRLGNLAPQQGSKLQVAINVEAARETEGVFKLRYRVASAGWLPFYDARLVTAEKGKSGEIEIVRRADVVQSTGEDWSNVALTLSTARTLGATDAPFLGEHELQVFDGSYRTDLGKAKENDAAASGMVQAPAALAEPELAEDKLENAPKKDVVQRQAQVELAGFQAQYMIQGRESISNSGTAKKVRISTDRHDGELAAFSVPKLDPQAYLTASFKVASAAPYLPGSVNLYRDGIYLGQGALPLLNEGEEVKLGFGADDLVQVERREVRRQTGEEGIISSSSVQVQAWDISIRNLHDFSIPVTVLDQMPFSANENVVVEPMPLMTEPTQKDYEKRRGVFAWKLAMEPKSKQQISFGYKVSWPKDLQVGLINN